MEIDNIVSSSDFEKEGISASKPCCGAINAVNVLALADTVEEIIPNNEITRYLKSKYETDSLQSIEDAEDDENTLNTMNSLGNTLDHTLAHTLDNTLDYTLDNTFDHSYDSTLDRTFDNTSGPNEDEIIVLDKIAFDNLADGNLGNTYDRLLATLDKNLENIKVDSNPDTALDENDEHPYDEGIEAWQSDNNSSVNIAMMYSLASKMDSSEVNTSLAASSKSESHTKSPKPTKSKIGSDDTSEGVNTTMNTTLDSAATITFAPWNGEQGNEKEREQLPRTPPSPSRSKSSTSSENIDKVSEISGNSGGTSKDWGIKGNRKLPPKDNSVEIIEEFVNEMISSSFIRVRSRGSRNSGFEGVEAEISNEKRFEEMKAIILATENSPTRNIEKNGKKKKGKWKKGFKEAKKTMKHAFQVMKKKTKGRGNFNRIVQTQNEDIPNQGIPSEDIPSEDVPNDDVPNEEIPDERNRTEHPLKDDNTNAGPLNDNSQNLDSPNGDRLHEDRPNIADTKNDSAIQ